MFLPPVAILNKLRFLYILLNYKELIKITFILLTLLLSLL